MSRSPRDDPYASIAAFYEAEFTGVETDAAYFARHGVPGPLLVLGCGTGRIARLLCGERAVTGLDRSEPMLAMARASCSEARFVLGDMRAFELGPFAEVIIPNAAFSFLPTRADQLECLRCCHRALDPGAPLTLDLPMPDFSWLGHPHTPERPGWQGVVNEKPAQRTREVWRYPVSQRLEILDRYFLDGRQTVTSKLILRLVFPAEAEWLLEAAGFYVDALHGHYGDEPLREASPRLIVRAVRV